MDGHSAYVADTLMNLVSNLGNAAKDKGAMGEFAPGRRVSRGSIDSLYASNWMAKKAVDVPADDMTREWRTWHTNKSAVADLEAAEAALRVRPFVTKALKLAAKDGGSGLILGGPGDPESELDVRTLQKGDLKYLHLVSRWNVSLTQMIYDPASPWFGHPERYVLLLRNGRTVNLHPSRMVVFQGAFRADAYMGEEPWGESVFQHLHDAIRNATSVEQAVASMVQEAKLDVVKIPGLSEGVVRADYRNSLLQRFSSAMMTKSISNALIFDSEEEYSQKTLTFQGIPDIMDRLLQIVAGAADMPVTRMLGQSPAGLNSTGKADLEGYYSMVRSRQETYLRPALERLDEALIRSALGRRPRGIYSEFRSLWSIPETDQSSIDLARANAVEAYSRAGIFTPEALQAAALLQLSEDSFLPEIDAAVAKFPGSPGNVQVQTTRMATEAKAAEAKAVPAPRRRPAPKPAD